MINKSFFHFVIVKIIFKIKSNYYRFLFYLLISSVVVLLFLSLQFSRSFKLSNQAIDISWPNCQLQNLDYSHIIVGLNGGLDFKVNNCLASQSYLTKNTWAYVNTGNPGLPRIKSIANQYGFNCLNQNLKCYSYYYGYSAGEYDQQLLNLYALRPPIIWLDVETTNSWTSSLLANRYDLLGQINALSSNHFLRMQIGIYSSPVQWVEIMGDWSIPYPIWLAGGYTNQDQASRACSLAGVFGAVRLVQYTVDKHLDFDYSCSNNFLKLKYF